MENLHCAFVIGGVLLSFYGLKRYIWWLGDF